MKQVQAVLAGFLMMVVFSCNKVVGEGPVVTEERNVISEYDGIDFQMPGNLSFTQDSVYKVELSAQRNVLEAIQTFVSNGRLVIRLVHGNNLRRHKPLQVRVSGPSLRLLRVSGSGEVTATTDVTTDQIDLNLSGSGTVTIPSLTADYANATISGSGTIKILGGAVQEENLDVSGSGNMDLSNVAAQKAETRTSGSGDIRLQVADALKVRISGSGSVYYKGDPVVESTISGSGKVVRL